MSEGQPQAPLIQVKAIQLQPPLSRRSSENLWDRIQSCRRVSAASLNGFAACTGFMPTLQPGREIKTKYGIGWMSEHWKLEDAKERLNPTDPLAANLYSQPPQVLPIDSLFVAGGTLYEIAGCPCCGNYFLPGEYVRILQFAAFELPEQKIPGVESTGTSISMMFFHAHHLYQDESYFVPLPTSEESKRAKALSSLMKDWRFRLLDRVCDVIRKVIRRSRRRLSVAKSIKA